MNKGEWMYSSLGWIHLRAVARDQRKNGCLLHQLTSGQWPVTKEKWMSSSPRPTHLQAMACDQRKMDAFFTYTNSPQSNGPRTKEDGCILYLDEFTSGQWPWPKENGCIFHLHELTSGQWPVTKGDGKWMPPSPTPTPFRALDHDLRKMKVFFIWPNSPEGNGPWPKVNRRIFHLDQLTSGQWLATKGKWTSSSSISRSFRRQSARLET